jgi:nucleotide-binding universal stress UspA family protein
MFKNILIPLDLTDKHQPALDLAAEFAEQSGGEVTLLHVIEIIPGLPFEEDKAFYTRLETKARGHLEKFGKPLADREIACHGEVLFGNRAQEIVRFARENRIDLVLLTTPAVDPDRPAAGWGSLSYKIGFFCPCPVLLVRAPAT